ncbi:hypothetical protein [Pseudoalteromonas sp. T1lg76]|uniref:hypothetical protein n=1 Tax=Pseudoalteromonas sp. T1lg76 TaxID=2077103 RepID=UPI000CF68CDF|nr:hypothetical protein [Pseudoalteromonas sp. T1lg76]
MAKQNFEVVTSLRHLDNMHGITLLAGLDRDKIKELQTHLDKLDGNVRLTMNLGLKDNITPSDIAELKRNDKQFNTYQESPLNITGDLPISPSILFVLAATQIPFEEFKDQLNGLSFTVNDLAAAIVYDIPITYIDELIKHTKQIHQAPLYPNIETTYIANLADLAAYHHNVPVLRALAKHGVTPTNQDELLTGLDLAIHNLPQTKEELAENQTRYIDTIIYLVQNGYSAHGTLEQDRNGRTWVRYGTPLVFGPYIGKYLDNAPRLAKAMESITLLPVKEHQAGNSDNHALNAAINKLNMQIHAFRDRETKCARVNDEIRTAKGLISYREIRNTVEQARNTMAEVEASLHAIDPALVNHYLSSLSFEANRNENNTSDTDLRNLLNAQDNSQLIDYVSTTALSQHQTDMLFRSLVFNPQKYALAWQNRVEPIPPSSVVLLIQNSLPRLVNLADMGLNLNIRDAEGFDLYMHSARHNSDALKFLVDNDIPVSTGHYGLDVLDLLLDESYSNGKLNENLKLVLPKITAIEPSHLARAQRLRIYKPSVYSQLVQLDKRLETTENTPINNVIY